MIGPVESSLGTSLLTRNVQSSALTQVSAGNKLVNFGFKQFTVVPWTNRAAPHHRPAWIWMYLAQQYNEQSKKEQVEKLADEAIP
jgi:hypothetical protein